MPQWYRIFYLSMKEKEKFGEFLRKVERYCEYQERCKSDIISKMVSLGVPEKMKELILYQLYERKYYDDNRFSKEYAIGKLRNNSWGKIKIRYNLKCKSIEKKIINYALKKIPEKEYTSIFYKIAKKEWESRSKLDLNSRKKGFCRALQGKGWEFDLINKYLLETTKK